MAKKTVNFFELVPLRVREWEEDENGKISVKQPRFFNKLAKKFIEPYLKKAHVNVRLDEHGSFTWRLCTGEHTMADIADRFNERFSCDDGVERLEVFMQYLEKCSMIEYVNIDELNKK